MNKNDNKILVIGIDGATFSVIDSLISRDKLPNFARLIREGVRANLQSTHFPNSWPAWVTCTTGVNPGKHGIYSFLIKDEKNQNSKYRIANADDIKAKPVWEIMGEYQKKSIVLNVPVTYPAKPVNGLLVTSILTPYFDEYCTYPKEFKYELIEKYPDYKFEINLLEEDLNQWLNESFESIEIREKFFLDVIEKREWDLFFAVFTESDRIQHRFWACIDENHPRHSEFLKKYGNPIYRLYERLDIILGRLLDKIDKKTTNVFIVSDHGFGPCYQSFNIQKWLYDHGYLYYNENELKRWLKIHVPQNILQLLQRINNKYRVRKSLSDHDSDINMNNQKKMLDIENSISALHHHIDWSRTRAFYTQESGIRIVSNNKEKIIEDIINRLKSQEYATGKSVFNQIDQRERLYWGEQTENIPDIVTIINHDISLLHKRKNPYSISLTNKLNTGDHQYDGIFIGWGNIIKRNNESNDMDIMDVASNILYALGVPLTKDMDGKIHLSFFKEFYNKQKRNHIEHRKGLSKKDALVSSKRSEDEKIVEERLKALGYL
ncbi:alkaline phosphatase family protein [bacterium]|nr:alkaline phosphatase family protein [bacterium]